MGFFNKLFNVTGPGKLGAALNALTAKHMVDNLPGDLQEHMQNKIIEALMQGSGRPYEYTEAWASRLDRAAYYGLAAQIFLRMNMPPVFHKCFAGGRWNMIDNPLIGLHTGDIEIEMAQRHIIDKYAIQIHL